ncbi:interleukin-7 isoform X5 [Gopherus evgoodei]|uniref:interleukin-7 isoform X5 n=1 Tax=Gopherus evgoodei TaxID=1825980 RepID=UPI0011CFBE9D|nr:interleukin-7 isoform X5 [Gopherus evgoodei]
MFHVFFRSVFGILPLFIVLLPVNSSTCVMENTTVIREKYENILSHDIELLENMSEEYRDRCCRNKRHETPSAFFCNDTQEIRSLQNMACDMLKFFYKKKINKDFRWQTARVSCMTLEILRCRCDRESKNRKVCILLTQPSKDTLGAQDPKKKCCQELCELKETIASLRSCWNKFEKEIASPDEKIQHLVPGDKATGNQQILKFKK